MTFSKARYLFLFLSLAGLHYAAAQPLCEVLLKPAFTYSTSGLVVTFEDRSTSFGLESTTAWDYGDGSSGDQQTAHYFTEPGTYTVCLTMTGAILPCEVSFCREVTVPFVSCADTLDAQFSWYTSATNTISFTDASLVVAAEEVLWEFGDGGTSMEQAPTHTWQLPGSQFVCLTRVLDGCTASFCERVQVDGNVTTCGPELFVDFTLEQINDSSIFTPNVVANNVIPLGAIWSYGDGNMDSTLIGSNAYLVPGAYQTCLLVGAVLTSNLDSCFSLVCHTADAVSACLCARAEPRRTGSMAQPFREQTVCGTSP